MIQVMKKQACERFFSEASYLDKSIVVKRSLRLLPYVIPSIEKWKRSLLKENDLKDFVAADI